MTETPPDPERVAAIGTQLETSVFGFVVGKLLLCRVDGHKSGADE